MTLGHIVASTKLGIFGKSKTLNGDDFLNKHGVEVRPGALLTAVLQVIKEIQDTLGEGGEVVSLEVATTTPSSPPRRPWSSRY